MPDALRSRIGDDSPGLLDSACGEAGDEAIHEEVIENGDGNAGDEAASHEGSPKVYITVDQESGHAHAHCKVSHGGNERHSIDELLHREGEAEDRDSEYPGERDGDDYTDKGPEAAVAIDHGGLFYILWDGFEEAHHQPGGEGNSERGVDQHQRP